MSYVMDFADAAEAPAPGDAVVPLEGGALELRVDPKSLLYLFGLRLDHSAELIGGGFKFFNPNSESSCGCGSSFSV
jgi:iron-sulfur cluster assembly accessory protein